MNRLIVSLLLAGALLPARDLDLSQATIVIRPGTLPLAEKTSARVLQEEIAKRTGLKLPVSTTWPQSGTAIAISGVPVVENWSISAAKPSIKAEGYRLVADCEAAKPSVRLMGADARGALFSVGQFFRSANWDKAKLSIPCETSIETSPAYAIRGHQLGYRAQANSYDAWDAATFEQYIRELTFFGVNSIESIPFHDDRPTPVMRVPRREINRRMGEICADYGLDYWAWIPAEFDLAKADLRAAMMQKLDEFFADTPTLTAVFFPGGDPGANPPELVLPFLADVGAHMTKKHPRAKVWLSLQWFKPPQIDMIYRYIEKEKPAWFGGLVAGPSSPRLDITRTRLPVGYPLRDYPDLTHNKLSQYEVPEWDQALASVLGREAINPRPAEYAAIFRKTAPFTNGFISYSDGIHDDVNKTIFSTLSWNPEAATREILREYSKVYFDPSVTDSAADGILALEKNWRGPVTDNGAIETTLLAWQQLENGHPELASNWRWQMCLLRAYYDAYVRHRFIYESQLEDEVNRVLASAPSEGSAQAIASARAVLGRASTAPLSPQLRQRIVELCDALYQSIGLQTSVDKYHAIGAQRGAVLDFIDLPLNNRWWLEDEFVKVEKMDREEDKVKRLDQLARWSHPGPGSFYDDLGNIANSPHVTAGSHGTTYWWWNEGKSRARWSWQITQWPEKITYEALDPRATYVVRSSGYGQALLRMNGQRVEPYLDGREMGEFKEWRVPATALADGKLVLTFDPPVGEEHLNWRNKSRLAEIWLLKQ